jgi:hypothetical protein
MADNEQRDFLAQSTEKRTSFIGDFGAFLKQNKKWWLIPIVVSVVVLGLLVILGGTGVAPFIYTLF